MDAHVFTPEKCRDLGLPCASFSFGCSGFVGGPAPGAYFQGSGPPGGVLRVAIFPAGGRGPEHLDEVLTEALRTQVHFGEPGVIEVAGQARACRTATGGTGLASALALAVLLRSATAAPEGLVLLLVLGVGPGADTSITPILERGEFRGILESLSLDESPEGAGRPSEAVDAVSLSREHFREGRFVMRLLAALLGLAGAAAAWGCAVMANGTTEVLQLGALAAMALLGAGGLFFLALHRRDRIAPFFQRLEGQPQDIVWLHLRRRRRAHPERGHHWIVLGMADGRTECLSVRGLGQAGLVLEALAARMPWVTAGWSLERERRFRRDPASLRRQWTPDSHG